MSPSSLLDSTTKSTQAGPDQHEVTFFFLCSRELTLDMPKMSCWNLARGYPKVVTQITVHSAEGLEKKYANERKNCRDVQESQLLFQLLHL